MFYHKGGSKTQIVPNQRKFLIEYRMYDLLYIAEKGLENHIQKYKVEFVRKKVDGGAKKSKRSEKYFYIIL